MDQEQKIAWSEVRQSLMRLIDGFNNAARAADVATISFREFDEEHKTWMRANKQRTEAWG